MNALERSYPEGTTWEKVFQRQPATGKWRGQWLISWLNSEGLTWYGDYMRPGGMVLTDWVKGRSRAAVDRKLDRQRRDYDAWVARMDEKDRKNREKAQRERWEDV